MKPRKIKALTLKKRYALLSIIALVTIFIVVAGFSYAFFTDNKNISEYAYTTGTLSIEYQSMNDVINLTNDYPMSSDEAFNRTPYGFTITNTGTISAEYKIRIETKETNTLDNQYVKVALFKNWTLVLEPTKLSNLDELLIIDEGIIGPNKTDTFALFMWIDLSAPNEVVGDRFEGKIVVDAKQTNRNGEYVDTILNGADPVLTDNLVPVTIEDDGTVKKADVTEEWYNYEDKEWANAVVLVDDTIKYRDGATIPESNIESYFVWIPKYSYQLWDMGQYTARTTLDSTKVHSIPIRFGLENTDDSVEGECTTPFENGQGISMGSGNCQVGDYMTHPAFLSFNTNGLWVAKFETGNKNVTSSSEAIGAAGTSSDIIIKPNTFTWRNLIFEKMFTTSYNYIRDDESHMMKNTEWGAVAYLTHSDYGSGTEPRVNNNSYYVTGYSGTEEPTIGHANNGITDESQMVSIDGNRFESVIPGESGTYSVPYNTVNGYTASTTGNISGIYDMSGGSWEIMSSYMAAPSQASGFNNLNYDNKYIEEYEKSNYNYRILGDATSELGPIGTIPVYGQSNAYAQSSSWYNDYIVTNFGFIRRGSYWSDGTQAGIFTSLTTGADAQYWTNMQETFRIVLAPGNKQTEEVCVEPEVDPNAVVYKETILNGTDPVLTDNLIPVTIADDGTVTMASIYDEWYDYEDREWANAVVLRKRARKYCTGQVIAEKDIQSYFVWIPKYSYQLWDMGNYTGKTTLDSGVPPSTKPQAISIRFGTNNTSDSISDECTTPFSNEQGISGGSGNCSVGKYMTHPAFLAFNTKGLWVGKFATGYGNYTPTTATAAIKSFNGTSSDVVIKPNITIWGNSKIDTAFDASYSYLREDESHMMKNTEWGAVAYLSHSQYGSATELRNNNNSAYVTGYASTEYPTITSFRTNSSTAGNRYEPVLPKQNGTYTMMYNTTDGYKSTTTGNITGIYDLTVNQSTASYVSGHSTTANATINVSDYDNKYFDVYNASSSQFSYNYRILGDATGEMGPFYLVKTGDGSGSYGTAGSWYRDWANFLTSSSPWFERGSGPNTGTASGIFAFGTTTGNRSSYRIVLAPTN